MVDTRQALIQAAYKRGLEVDTGFSIGNDILGAAMAERARTVSTQTFDTPGLDPKFTTLDPAERLGTFDSADLNGFIGGFLDNFLGQSIMRLAHSIADNDDILNPHDPLFDGVALAKEQGLPDEEIRSLMLDLASAKNVPEYNRLIQVARQNKFNRDYTKNSEVGRFIGSVLDVDLFAPLGVAKGIGFARGAVQGAGLQTAFTLPTEAARMDLTPGEEAMGPIQLTAPLIAGSLFGGIIGRKSFAQRIADQAMKQSGRLSDAPPRSDEIIKAGKVVHDILRKEAKARGIKTPDPIEPSINKDGSINAASLSDAVKLADDDYAPIDNFLSAGLAKTEQMPYWVLAGNKLGGSVGRSFSKLAHELSGRIGFTKGGVTEAGLGYMWQQHRFPMNKALEEIDSVYLQYRGNPTVQRGATRMMFGNFLDDTRNLYSQIRRGERAIPFTNRDYHNWLPWATAYKTLDEQVEGVDDVITLRDVFNEHGWGDAEWDILREGAKKGQEFYEGFYQKLQSNRLVGRESQLRRGEEAVSAASKRYKSSTRLYKEAEKLKEKSPETAEAVRKIARKQFLTALQLEIDEIYFRRIAGDSGIETVRLGAVLQKGLKFQREYLEGLRNKKYKEAPRDSDPSDNISALEAEYKDVLKNIEDGVDQPEYVFHVGSSGNKETIYKNGLTAGGIQSGRPVDDYGYGDRVYVFDASDLPNNFKNFADVSGAGPSYKPIQPLFDISIDELPKFKDRRGYGPRASELGDGPQPKDDLFDTATPKTDYFTPLIERIKKHENANFDNIDEVRSMLKTYEDIMSKLGEDEIIRIKTRARNQNLDADEWTFSNFAAQARAVADDLDTAILKEDIGDFTARNDNYYTHLYNPYKLDTFEAETKSLLAAAFRANPYVNGKRLYTDEDSLAVRVDEAFENMRRRGAFQDSEGVTDGVEKAVSGFSPRQTIGRKLPLTTRQLLRDRPENSLIDTDYRNVMNTYVNRVAPALTAAEQFGDPSLYRKFDQLDLDLDDAVADALIKGDVDNALRIEKEGNSVWRSGENLRDLNLNAFGFTEDPTTMSARSLRAAKNFGIVNLMGRSGQMLLGDSGRMLVAMSVKEILDQISLRIRSPQEVGLAKAEVELAGEVGETVTNSRAAMAMEYQGGLMNSTRTENFLSKAVPFTFIVNGMAPGTDFLKKFVGVHAQSEIIRLSKKVSENAATDDEISKLAEFGFDKASARKIFKQWDDNVAEGPGQGTEHLYIAGTQDWTDIQLRNQFRSALNKEMNRIILTPGPEHKPLFMTKNLWGYLLQFRTFSIASTQEQLLPMLQRPRDKRLWRGALGMLIGGIIVQQLRANPFDTDNFDKALRAIDYSGVIPLLMEPNNVLEIISMGNVGLRALGGGESLVRDVSPYEAAGAVAGPAGSVFLSTLSALQNAEEPSEYAKALTQLTPLRTWYANFIPALAKETAGQFDDE